MESSGTRWRKSRDRHLSLAWRRTAGLGLAAVVAAGGGLLASPAATVLAANPTPPFTQCPAVAVDTSCAILIVIQPDGSLTIRVDASQAPFDGSEDTLVGVKNNSPITVPSIAIGSATLTVFGFETPTDGICKFPFTGNGYCTATPLPPTGYEGPDTRFSAISADKKMGTVNFTDAGGGLAAGATTFFSLEGAITATSLITGAPTSLAFTNTSATTSDFADPATVAATLTAAAVPVPNATVTFTMGTGPGADTCTGTTNASGVASCSVKPTQPAGLYQITASFAGSSIPFQAGVATSSPFTVTHEQDGLTYTGAGAVVVGHPLVLSGALTTDDPSAGTPLAGKTIKLTLGSGTSAQTCSGVTNSLGVATCTIASVLQSAGSVAASASFAGDTFYEPAAANGAVTVTAPAPTPGVAAPETGAAGDIPVAPAVMLMLTGGGLVALARRRRGPRG
jgi:hypothetical protein